MGMIPIRCATCGEASQIDEAWAGRWVGCPHCRRPTLAVAATDLTAPPPPPIAPPAVPAEEATTKPARTTASAQPTVKPAPAPTPSKPAVQPVKRPPLTRAQRLAIRRRRHFVLALGGAVILLAAAYALFSLNN